MNYIVVKQENELHIYFPNKNGTYVNKSESYDWMCTINKDEDKFVWNDYFIPTLKDMKFILDIFNNFDKNIENATEDDFLTEDEME